MRSDLRLTLRMISSELHLHRFTVHQILTRDLDNENVCSKIVLKNATTEQNASRINGYLEFGIYLRECLNSSVALSKVMNRGFWSRTPRHNAILFPVTYLYSPDSKPT
jgi:hypothetical protein